MQSGTSPKYSRSSESDWQLSPEAVIQNARTTLQQRAGVGQKQAFVSAMSIRKKMWRGQDSRRDYHFCLLDAHYKFSS
jgi:hypothetical protein